MMLGNIGREGVKKLSDDQLEKELVSLTTDLHVKHGYSVDDASIFVNNCYLLIDELRTRKPDMAIKLI